MNTDQKIVFCWEFFQKLRHNLSHKELLQFVPEAENIDTPPLNKNFIQTTKKQEKWSFAYLEKAWKYLPMLRFLPGVRAVAVCNSAAMGTANEASDIDVLIITSPKKLWTARIFCTAFLHFLGVRRHGKRVKGRFCLSFFITKNAMNFEKIALLPHDPYLAFWVSTLHPIFGKDLFLRLADENRKFVKHNAHIPLLFLEKLRKEAKKGPFLQKILEKMCGNWCEFWCKKIFLPRTLAKKRKLKDDSGIIISENILKFHNSDRRKEFL